VFGNWVETEVTKLEGTESLFLDGAGSSSRAVLGQPGVLWEVNCN
jgi:hypothetical protein